VNTAEITCYDVVYNDTFGKMIPISVVGLFFIQFEVFLVVYNDFSYYGNPVIKIFRFAIKFCFHIRLISKIFDYTCYTC
jgi:hypothetical protein